MGHTADIIVIALVGFCSSIIMGMEMVLVDRRMISRGVVSLVKVAVVVQLREMVFRGNSRSP